MNETDTLDEDASTFAIFTTSCGIIFCVLFSIGFTGNLSLGVAILYNKSMRTATNFYILSLTISNLTIAAGESKGWIYSMLRNPTDVLGRRFCLFELFLGEVGNHAGLIVLSVVAVTRYVAICRPRHQRNVEDISKAMHIIAICWSVACCLAIPQAAKYMDHCNSEFEPEVFISKQFKLMTSLWSSVLYFGFMIFVVILYMLTAIELNASRTRNNDMVDEQDIEMIKMLLTLSTAFFICWIPLQIFRPIFYYLSMDEYLEQELVDKSGYIEVICALSFYWVSTAITPIIVYCLCARFRRAVKNFFCCHLETITTELTA